jgi:type IV pilus assembly protein PilQ
VKPTLLALLCALPLAPAETEARVSLDLRDAEVLDVVRLLSEVGGFQLVVDPGVSCRLTLSLKRAPWPTVLKLALKSCGLGYEEEGGILRVAEVRRLAEQARAERQLGEARQQARERSVTSFRLSYARASEMAEVLRKTHPAAQVTFDARTNTLIVVY